MVEVAALATVAAAAIFEFVLHRCPRNSLPEEVNALIFAPEEEDVASVDLLKEQFLGDGIVEPELRLRQEQVKVNRHLLIPERIILFASLGTIVSRLKR